ncbi:conserved hypothetical protein [Histoplasma capsulatum H143]|uniref:Uncharacterized protein n=1 Tax=Ajellomyces capsulatus (strain H143) TaxID=544712 RepID=C6HKA7_AJECH|nr:conserved hypothetical protein [Histoplasma capsulatum H143]
MAASPAREESRSSYPVPSASPQRAPRAVMFLPETHTVPTESSRNTSGLCQVRMEEKLFQTFPGDRVTDSMLGEAAKLFNENYGIWGKLSHSPAWTATALLRSICADTDDMYGIMSSHPAACMAAASSYGTRSTWVLILVGGIEKAPLGLVEANAKAVLEASPIPYIKNARLCGSLFNPEDSTGLVCGVDTGFFVDHKEPLEVVEVVRQDLQWPLGDLPEGHEYLLILPGKKRRSRSSSSSQSKGDVMPTH